MLFALVAVDVGCLVLLWFACLVYCVVLLFWVLRVLLWLLIDVDVLFVVELRVLLFFAWVYWLVSWVCYLIFIVFVFVICLVRCDLVCLDLLFCLV